MRLLSTALTMAALSLSFTGIARAQFEIAWDKCPGSMGSATSKRFDCATDQPLQMVVAFTPQKSLPRFVGIWIDVEFSSANGDIPDWWRAGTGECREGAVGVSLSPGRTLGECRNPWAGSQTGGGSFFTSGFGGAGKTLMSFAFARTDKIPLMSGTRYMAAVIEVDGSSNSSCSGCNAEVCIAVTTVRIAQERNPETRYGEDDPETEILYTRSTSQTVVSFNAANPAANACGSKVRNKTWGQVKSTYR